MPSIVDKILGFRFALKSSPNEVMGVDIGSSSMKIVHLKKKGGGLFLENYGSLSLGPYAGLTIGQPVRLSTDKLVEVFSDLLRESEISVPEAAFAIPVGSTLLSFITLPTTDRKQLEQMVPIEARKHIPVPITEVVLDWQILGTSADGGEVGGSTNILIVAVQNDILNKYKRIEKRANLHINSYEIEIFSSIRSIVGDNKTQLVVVDIGAGTTKVAMIEYGVVKSYHVINRGAQDITIAIAKSLGISTEKAEILKRDSGIHAEYEGRAIDNIVRIPIDHMFSEIKNILVSYQKKTGKPISQVLLTGGGALLQGITEIAGESLNAEVALANPFSKVEFPAFLESTLKKQGQEFSVAVGVAMKAISGK